MFNYKYQFYNGLTGGLPHMETHLAEMATTGRMVDKIGALFMRYKRCEPQTLRFYVAPYPGIGLTDYPDSESVQNWRKRTEQDGWQLAAYKRHLHIFFTEDENIPRPVSNAQDLMQAYRKQELAGAILQMVILLWVAYTVILRDWPGVLFSDFSTLFVLGLPPAMLGVALHAIVGATWYFAARQADRRHRPPPIIPRKLCRAVQHLLRWGTLWLCLCFGVGLWLTMRGGEMQPAVLLFIFGFGGLATAFGVLIRHVIDKRCATTDRNITMVVVGILGVVVLGVVVSSFMWRLMLPTSDWEIAERPPEIITSEALGLGERENVIARYLATSILVPRRVFQWERTAYGDIIAILYDTINPAIARVIFRSPSRYHNDWFGAARRWRYRDTGQFSTAEFWGVCDAALFKTDNDEALLVLRSGNRVLSFSTRDMPLPDAETLRDVILAVFADNMVE